MATMYDCSNRSTRDVYDDIKKYYEETNQCLDKANKLYQDGKIEEALGMFEFGLTLIDQALSQPIESPTAPDIEWEKAYSMIQKMRKLKKEILCRISDAQSKQSSEAALPPPSYEEAVASGSSSRPVEVPGSIYMPASAMQNNNSNDNPVTGFADLNVQLNDLRVTGNREIIYSHNNVRLYFIAPDGRVSATSEPETLTIGRIEDMTHDDVLDDTLLSIVDQLSAEGTTHRKHHRRHHGHHRRHRGHHRLHESARKVPEGQGQIYLQVGSWIYPLIPGISPVFRADFGAFVLPDVYSEMEGAAVGIILPQNADKSVYDLLNSILLNIVGVQDLPSKEPLPNYRTKRSDRADKKTESAFANKIVRGASYLANNLVRGAGNASRLLDAATPRIMTKIYPATEPKPVNPTLKSTVSVAKTVSDKAATVSDYLAGKVGDAASALGQYLAPHIQRGGTRLLTSTTSMTGEEAASRVESLLGATASAVQGIGTVYSGLETAAGILGRSLANNTVQIIEYKYGQPLGEVTGDAMSTMGNVYNVHGNYKFLKPTKVAQTVAKSAIAGTMAENSWPHEEFQGNGPGSGSGFRTSMSKDSNEDDKHN